MPNSIDWKKVQEAQQLIDEARAATEWIKNKLKDSETRLVFGKNLKTLLPIKGFDTLNSFAVTIKMDSAALSRVIKGEKAIGFEKYLRICSEIGINPYIMIELDLATKIVDYIESLNLNGQ